jgi:hypothetical protein
VRQRRSGESAFDEQPELLDGRHREQPGLLEVREGSANRLVHDHVGRIRPTVVAETTVVAEIPRIAPS